MFIKKIVSADHNFFFFGPKEGFLLYLIKHMSTINDYIEQITPLQFTEPKISTIACIGKIFDEKIVDGNSLNLYEISDAIDMGKFKNIKYIECNYNDPVHGKMYLMKGSKEEESDAESDNEIPEVDIEETDVVPKKGFANSVTIAIKLTEKRKPIKSKLATNGSLQLPGFKSKEEIDLFIEMYKELAASFPANLIEPKIINVQITMISMIKYDIIVKTKDQVDVPINPSKMISYIVKETSLYGSYEGTDSHSAEISWKNETGDAVECYPFHSGKINITSLRSFEELYKSYQYITEFIRKNITHVIMFTNQQNLLLLLEKYQSKGDQKSLEWEADRTKGIGASEVSSVFGMAFSKSRDGFIKEKVKSRLTGRNSAPFGNASTRFGCAYELIAIQLYVRHFNAGAASQTSKKTNYRIAAMGTSSVKHPIYPFITASTDALILCFDPDDTDLWNYQKVWTLDDLKKAVEDKKLINFYTLEIKCPTNYQEYDHNSKKIVECTNGYVPSYYWCQVQQQQYVLGAQYGVFMNNNFKEISEEEWDLEKTCYKGVIMKVYENDFSKAEMTILYPKNVVDAKELSIKELNTLAENEGFDDCVCKIVYWRLVSFRLTDVELDPTWETEYVPKIIQCNAEIDELVELERDAMN